MLELGKTAGFVSPPLQWMVWLCYCCNHNVTPLHPSDPSWKESCSTQKEGPRGVRPRRERKRFTCGEE
ncbi:hypothetical protein MATL_G00247120 [Megalops atlanticus]|uniref:Uncharacterized protein n=1 Tax=Megalops atlanticus TaxID=7932 RepID=A0A9D3PDC9_MEGAT|nr:hypothetical protein MATL_G00247120 [Megalops atlanticus]